MMIPEGILCSKSHEYLLEGENGIYTVGLTDYAVEQLGDIVFIELPEAGTEFAKLAPKMLMLNGDNSPVIPTIEIINEIIYITIFLIAHTLENISIFLFSFFSSLYVSVPMVFSFIF